MRTKSNFHKTGLTLIELMVTLSLASILLVLGFKGFSDMISLQTLKSGVEQSALAIKEARYYATSKGVVARINFAVGSNSYSITADGKAITGNNNFSAMSGILPDKVKISSNSCGNLGFYVDGVPVDLSNQPILADCTIKISYNGTSEKSVIIQAGTGNVTNEE